MFVGDGCDGVLVSSHVSVCSVSQSLCQTFLFVLGQYEFLSCFRLAPHSCLVLIVLYIPCPSFVTRLLLGFVLTGGVRYSFASCFQNRALVWPFCIWFM